MLNVALGDEMPVLKQNGKFDRFRCETVTTTRATADMSAVAPVIGNTKASGFRQLPLSQGQS